MSLRVHSGSLTERMLDRLETEGGWMAISLIADFFPNEKLDSIRQTLKRLRAKGMIESRPLVKRTEFYQGQPENEWRVHPDAEW